MPVCALPPPGFCGPPPPFRAARRRPSSVCVYNDYRTYVDTMKMIDANLYRALPNTKDAKEVGHDGQHAHGHGSRCAWVVHVRV